MKKIMCLAFISAVFLSGCGLTKKDLGLSRSIPDETQVQTRSNLVLPPDFDVLPD